MIDTIRKKLIGFILVLAVAIILMPAMTFTADAVEESGPSTSLYDLGPDPDPAQNTPPSEDEFEDGCPSGTLSDSDSDPDPAHITPVPEDENEDGGPGGNLANSDPDTDPAHITPAPEDENEDGDPDSNLSDSGIDINQSLFTPMAEMTGYSSTSTSLTGSGTAAAPFLIASAADLAYMRDQVNANGTIMPSGGGAGVTANTAHYKLTNHIVLGYWQDDGDGIVDDGEIYDSASGGTVYSASNWTPIGSFKGTFDGDGWTVSGVYINTTSDYQGLFGLVEDGTVKNMGVKDSYIKGNSFVGGVVGRNSGGTIQGCYNTGTVSGYWYVGGVVGSNGSSWIQAGTIQYCYNIGSVSGTGQVGGVVGQNLGTTGATILVGEVQSCYNTGSVRGGYGSYEGSVGGVVGYNSTVGKVDNCYNSGSISGIYTGGVVGYNENIVQCCYNTGSVSGTSDAGGVVGYNKSPGTVESCYNTGSVSGTSNFIGGIVGTGSNVTGCYNTGSVSGTSYVGGIVGNGSNITSCYNTGSVSGDKNAETYVGGIVGYGSNVTSCYNTGSVSGVQYVGGVAGRNNTKTVTGSYNSGSVSGTSYVGGVAGINYSGAVTSCYNSGSVSGTSYVGGVVGGNIGTVTSCYYDKQMCPVGGIKGTDSQEKAEGKTTAEMTSGTTFTGWNSETWKFTANLYPRLTGMDETDAAYVSAAPVFLASTDTVNTVKTNFTLSTANGVSWSSSDGSVISIDDNSATVESGGTSTLTASRGGIAKSISLTAVITMPTLVSAARDSDTQITVKLNKPCSNLTHANDGGFTVTETGTPTTFTVLGTAQGVDASHVVLNVADMDTAKAKGVTVTYTAGGNGTITDIEGNPLATDSTGVVIDPWITKLNTPESLSWDITTPAKATWGAVANASSYTIQLYKDGTASGSPVTGITNTTYDFTSVITETGSYTFTVTAIGDDTTYLNSDTSSNSPAYTDTFSAPVAGFGNALSFYGNTGKSKIIVPYNDSTKLAGNTDFTISMWICPNNNEPYQTLYRQHGTSSESFGLDFRFIKNNDDEGYLYCQFNKLGTGWQRVFNWGDATSIANVKKVPMNQWTHVALVKSGKSVQTYINGEADVNYGQMTLDDIRYNAPAPASADISIGVGITTEAQYFSGRMDEVQYWNSALDENQVEAWMYREIDSTQHKYNNLVYYYKLNENSGIAVADSKGTNHGSTINITDSNWVASDIRGWTVNAGTTLNGKLVGSDVDGTSTNGTDWKLTFAIESQGAKGEAVITEDNQFTYTVGINQEGSDSFQYKVCDSNGNYSNVQTVNIDIIPAKTISGNVGVAGTTLSYNDGTEKIATADETGAYSFKVPNNWSGTVTPSKDGYKFSPANKEYTNVQADQTDQDYTATPIITSASVSGIIAPATGGIPIGIGSLEGTGVYTVTSLTWQNSDGSMATLTDGGKFKADSTYQAVIELTAATGYKFEVLTPTVSAGTAGAGTINPEGNKLTFTVTFAETEAQSVAAITIKTQPNKLSYTAGETLDLAGLEVTLTYNDGSSEDISCTQFEDKDITANPHQGTTITVTIHNGQPITLTCNTRTATTNTLTVIKADITGITFDNKTITYNGAEHKVEISGTLPGGAEVSYTGNTGTSAGTYNATASITGGDTYKDLMLHATLTINKATLTVTDAAVADKVYDGGTAATISGATLTGVITGDIVTLENKTAGTFADKNVGNDKTVTTAMTISGTDAGNYSLTQPTLTGNITKKALTVSEAVVTEKVYDGNTAATITGATLSGLVSGDNVSVGDAAAGTFDDKNVGTDKTVTTAMTISGTDKYNYSLTQPTLTGNIVKAMLVAAVGDYSKTYGEENPTFAVEVSGFVNGETAKTAAGYTAPTASSAATTATDAGEAEITISGGAADNYTFDISDKGTLTINKKALTAIAVANDKTYDGNTAATGTISLAGVVGTDDVTVSGNFVFATADAGGGKTVNVTGITLAGADARNYTADESTTTTANIEKANINGITLDSKTVTYDGTEHKVEISGTLPDGADVNYTNNTGTNAGTNNATATINGGTNYNDLTLNATLTINKADITGVTFENKIVTYKGAEHKVEISGTLPEGAEVSYTGNIDTNAGTYNATATIDGGNNYNDLTLNATLTINKASLTAAVGDYSKTYGEENPIFAVEVTGFVNGETAGTAAGYTAPTASSAATTATDAGTAEITISGGAADNYTFDISDKGTLTINKKELTAIAVANDKTYDGNTAATGTISLAGVVGTDDVTVSGNFVFATADAGAGKTVNVTGIILAGTDAGNYTVEESTTSTADIEKADISGISFEALNGTYDGTAKTIQISGTLPEGAEVSYTGNIGTNAGTYNSTASITGKNYNDLTLNATLTINKASLTAAVGDYSKTYGEENPIFAVEVSGFVNGETAATAAGYNAPIASTTATAATGAGTAEITINGGAATNYTFDTSDKGILTINKKTLTVIAVADNKIYDGTVSATGTISLSGIVGSDDVFATGTFNFEDNLAGVDKVVNVTEITLGGAQSGNYSLSTATITAKADIIKSTNAELSGLLVSADLTLSPAFSAEVTSYSGNVSHGTSSITITPTTADSTATVKINGDILTEASSIISLNTGENTITIEVTAQDGITHKSYILNISRAGGGSSTPPSISDNKREDSEVDIIVNGNVEQAATSTTSIENNKTVTTINVDDQKVAEKLDSESDNAIVRIQVNNISDVVVGQLNGQTVKNMEMKSAILELKTGNTTYTLPASQINIDNVSSQIGTQVGLNDIKVNIRIAEPPADTMKIIEDTANKNSYQIVVKPTDFEITCTSAGKTINVSKFNGYVERILAIPDGVDSSKITTGIILNDDGTFSHVPTTIIVIDGKYYAKINSLTNSTYSVIYNPVEFTDVADHWAKSEVNDMGSRLVVRGAESGIYLPESDITRAEFATIIVRALGLRAGTEESKFSDVMTTDWHCGYIETASAYGFIIGYGDGSFRPKDKISREQAMAIIARAMKITALQASLSDSEGMELLNGYSDAGSVSNYAKESIAECLKTGIITGKAGPRIAPLENITRAEVAVIVQRLLKKSDLI